MICQVLKCKKQESKKHVGTICEYHAKKLEKWQGQRGDEYDPYDYKVINLKNCVWEKGYEHVRAIPTNTINAWLKNAKAKKQTLEDMARLISEQIVITNEKIAEHQKTKNSRHVKNEY